MQKVLFFMSSFSIGSAAKSFSCFFCLNIKKACY
nr:MAG TPA: hypothetical protein [Caudoviricetes sp.]